MDGGQREEHVVSVCIPQEYLGSSEKTCAPAKARATSQEKKELRGDDTLRNPPARWDAQRPGPHLSLVSLLVLQLTFLLDRCLCLLQDHIWILTEVQVHHTEVSSGCVYPTAT